MFFCGTCGRQVDAMAALCPGCGRHKPVSQTDMMAGVLTGATMFALPFVSAAAQGIAGLFNSDKQPQTPASGFVPQKGTRYITLTHLSWPTPLGGSDDSRVVLGEDTFPLDSWETVVQFHRESSYRALPQMLNQHLPGFLAMCRQRPMWCSGVILPNADFTFDVFRQEFGVEVAQPTAPKQIMLAYPPFKTWFDRTGQVRCKLFYFACPNSKVHRLENGEHLECYRIVGSVDDQGPLGMKRVAAAYETEAMVIATNHATNETLYLRDDFEESVMPFWQNIHTSFYGDWDAPEGFMAPPPWGHIECFAEATTRQQVEQVVREVNAFINAQSQG